MQPCPRQGEATMSSQLSHQSKWEERTEGLACSYCGSMHPDAFFKAISDKCELGPTDKDYKVYVEVPDPRVGEPWIYSVANFKFNERSVLVTGENINQYNKITDFQELLGKWVEVGLRPAKLSKKFYFYHLSEEEQLKFIDLLNRKEVNIGIPGYFYVLPFFAVKTK